jgi:hypothetical protein
MHRAQKAKPMNRFSIVDLAVDLFIFAWPLSTVFGIDPPNLLPNSDRLLTQSVDMLALTLGFFGLALYFSRMYAATALKGDRGPYHHLLFPSTALSLFTVLVVLTVVLSAYSILSWLSLPLFSALLVIAQALLFGFTLGLDYDIERHRGQTRYDSAPKDNRYSQSLASIPYLLATIAIVFLTEHFIALSDWPLVGKIITFLAACVAAYLVANKLDRMVFGNLRIGTNMGTTTVVTVSFLMIVGFLGFNVLSIVTIADASLFGSSSIARLLSLVFFGIVPIRVGSVLFSRANVFNRAIGTVVVIAFLLFETGLVDLTTVR